MNKYRCETCKNKDCDLHTESPGNINEDTGDTYSHFHWYYSIIDKKGCASHSDFNPQAERDVQELFREEIAKWKDEDPLFMSYVYGQRAGRKEEREKVLKEVEIELNNAIEHDCKIPLIWLSDIERIFKKLQEGKDGK